MKNDYTRQKNVYNGYITSENLWYLQVILKKIKKWNIFTLKAKQQTNWAHCVLA